LHFLHSQTAEEPHESPKFFAGRVTLLWRNYDPGVKLPLRNPGLMKYAIIRDIERV